MPLPPEKPRPKPPKPKPGPAAAEVKPKPKPLPMPARPPPVPEPERDGVVPEPRAVDPILQKPFISCETYRLCPPPPAVSPATVHLRSGRLPTPLIAVSATLLAVSALLLLALLVRILVRRRRGQQQEEEAMQDDDEESVRGVDPTAWGGQVEEEMEQDGGGVHHVWYIRTKGLDERAIAAISAVVYDASWKKNRGAGAVTDGGGCAVCLAEFRDGETLRLLPRCAHAFHRGCIDPWLRAHVNCPLCRAPVVQVSTTSTTTFTTAPGSEDPSPASSGRRTVDARSLRVPPADRAVRRAASMVTIPRRAWPDPDVSLHAPTSSSGREEDMMTGLAKIRNLLKFSEALDAAAGIGAGRWRSASFSAAVSCQHLPTITRSVPSSTTASAGVNGGDEIEQPSR